MLASRARAALTSWVPGFVGASVIWGASFALIKVAVDAAVAPVWIAFWRCFFGAVTLVTVSVLSRAAWPRDWRVWAHTAVVGVLWNAVPFTLFSFGETKISSVLAGVWNATTPLATTVFVLFLVREERPSLRRILGLAVGFLGVLLVLGVWHGVPGGLLVGSLACLGATTCYGAGFAYTRRFLSGRNESASTLTALQIGFATVELGLAAPIADGAPTWPGWTALACLVGLGAFGTGFAFLLNMRVIRAAGPTVASTVTYLTPLWSTLFGAVLLAEPVGWNTVLGAVVIIAGVVLTRQATPRPAPVTAEVLAHAR